jgi:hypothetical protein
MTRKTAAAAPSGAAGASITLDCSCEAKIVVPTIVMMPRHHVVRVVAHGARCRERDHRPGSRLIVRWVRAGGRRVYRDVSASR